jgi:hypothetical protein
VGSNPAAPTKKPNVYRSLFYHKILRWNAVREHKGAERHVLARKVPRNSHAVWLTCSLFGFFCTPGQAPGQQEFYDRQAAMPPIIGKATVSDGDTLEIGGRQIRLPGIDFEYLFAQVKVRECEIDTSPNCGNMLSGVPSAGARDQGQFPHADDGQEQP